MIRSFRHRGLKRLYERDTAHAPQALDIPRYRLHPLKGEVKGLWSVTVRANWRIVFRFEGTDAFDVELIDYH
jgi:proteic killer suppression protein